MSAFKLAQTRINPQKIVEYAGKYGIATEKRLGWVFETLGIFPEEALSLKKIPSANYYRLDVRKPKEGILLGEWNLRRNF